MPRVFVKGFGSYRHIKEVLKTCRLDYQASFLTSISVLTHNRPRVITAMASSSSSRHHNDSLERLLRDSARHQFLSRPQQQQNNAVDVGLDFMAYWMGTYRPHRIYTSDPD